MDKEAAADFSTTLQKAGQGDEAAAAALFPLVYDQLHRLAQGYLRGRAEGHTLQPTAVVHEAFLRMARPEALRIGDRSHFIAVAATAMRQILIDHARRRGADKRGGGLTRVTLEGQAGPGDEGTTLDVIALDTALHKLAALNPRQARIIELQYFGGMTAEEVAGVLRVSRSLVEKDWRRARAWMRRELSEAGAAPTARGDDDGGKGPRK